MTLHIVLWPAGVMGIIHGGDCNTACFVITILLCLHSFTETANDTGAQFQSLQVDSPVKDNEGQWQPAQNISDTFFCGPPCM